MIELIFVCTLLSTFEPPADWAVVKIEPGHQGMCLTYPCSPTDVPTRATLKRSVKAGETVKLPDACREATAYGHGRIIITPAPGSR